MTDPASSAVSNLKQMYVALLLLPHNSLRMRLQPELAACRDTIAFADDSEPEAVQNDYEATAARIVQRLPVLLFEASIPSVRCASCDNGVEHDWTYCPYCGAQERTEKTA